MAEPPPIPIAATPLNYAGPDQPQDQPSYWAHGQYLVMRTDAVLPMRCIFCNQPAERRIRKRFFWADTHGAPNIGALRYVPYVRSVSAFGSMFRWFAGLRTAQFVRVEIPICDRHLRRARIMRTIGFIAFPLALSTLWLNLGDQLRLWLPVIGFFTSAILLSKARALKAVHAGIGHVTLSGVGPGYLSSLPSPVSREDHRPSIAQIASSAETLRERMAAIRRNQE